MSKKKSIECRVEGFRSRYKYEPISFDAGTNLSLTLDGETGPKGISAKAADLLDFAAAIYQIERQLRRKPTSPPERFTLSMQLREPRAWNDEAISAARDALYLLGDAVWDLEFRPGLRSAIPNHQPSKERAPKRVVLFSGGMDSTCGLATSKSEARATQLVSFYTRQKTLQREIAAELGYERRCQWRMKWDKGAGPGHAFFYRSLLFLSLGAAIAESWDVKNIFQYENGVLATAVPPGPAWLMTKHAHPLLHKHTGRLFSALFGGDWKISNPFLPLTKRECVEKASKAIGKSKMMQVLGQTETCWFLWSHRVIGGMKDPGLACGICIPCIVRRTTKVPEKYAFDLLRRKIRNDPRQGTSFRSYYIFLEQVLKTKGSTANFYAMLPTSARELVATGSLISLKDVHELFLKFGKEFMSTFKLR
jgi:7-cyano-7-deazaguanine synthase in queuosine biosynthesis